MHQYASDCIEYVYSTETEGHHENSRREMVYAFYGQYFLLMKEMGLAAQDVESAGKAGDPHITLKQFLE